jgi:hypothetical protein
MVTQVQSSSRPNKQYDVTIEKGVAVDCNCPDRFYRGHICKHMISTQVAIMEQKGAMFQALKSMVQGIAETAKANREMASDSRFA